MTTIAELAHKDTRAGSGRHWHSHTYPGKWNYDERRGSYQTGYREIWHYSTLMLRYTYIDTDPTDSTNTQQWDGNLDTVYVNTGHGSKSDQGGMNTLFRELDMPLYFSRAGGAQIEHLIRTGHDNPYYERKVFQS